MHPALSVIFFTTASGAGYGLLFLLALGLGCMPELFPARLALGMLLTGLLLGSAGLLSSMLHLGRPERAWRAFSQWRSSWLSREGVIASFTFLPALLLGGLLCSDRSGLGLRLDAAMLAVCASLTVFCTARIYSTLKTVHAWHNGYVLPTYLLLALSSGAVWSLALAAWLGIPYALSSTALATLALLLASIVLKWRYWRFIANSTSSSSIESATGLGHLGRVSSFERPHTEQNYLLREMGYVLARKHARRLRRDCVLGLFTSAMLLLPLILRRADVWNAIAASASAILVFLAVLLERWLFFAEARHLVTLYYETRER